MKPLTREWATKAEGDFATLTRESQVRRKANYDGICFHAQQCAEKYLKALLCEAGIPFAKVHDLVALLDEVLPSEPALERFRGNLALLTAFGVDVRYPGRSADRQAAADAAKHCRAFREAARKALKIPTAR